MFKKIRYSIRKKLFVSIAATLILVFAAVAGLLFVKTQGIVKKGLDNTLSSEAKYLSESISQYLVAASTVASQLGTNELINDYIDKAESKDTFKSIPEYNTIVSTLKSLRSSNEYFTAVYIGLDRINYLLTDGEWENSPDFVMKERGWYKNAINKDGLFFSEPYKDVLTGKIVTTVSIPLKDKNGNIIGVGGVDLTIDQITDMMGKFKTQKSGFAFLVDSEGKILYHSDSQLIMTNITETENGELGQIGQRMINGESKVDNFMFNKKMQYLAYTPVELNRWSIGVVVPISEVEEELRAFGKIYFLAFILSLIAIFLIVLFITGKILKPVPVLLKSIEAAGKGDLTVVADVDSKDEIGQLAESFNRMVCSQRNMIEQVLKTSGDIFGMAEKQGVLIKEIGEQTEDTSATVEQLSAGMQETAASAEEMNASSFEIERAATSISEKSNDGAVTADEISKRAKDLNSNFRASREAENRMYTDIKCRLDIAIENAKAVDQINVLSDSILQITSQTNLLALNAAIEAARAGESGRGFAVVAEEIRVLAEQSKSTVSQIQNVTKSVIGSMQELTDSSQQMLNFFETQVDKDYRAMLKTSELYSDDADYISSMTSEFSNTSMQLKISIQNIIKAINEVTATVNEGASGTQNIAEKTALIVDNVQELQNQIHIANESAKQLKMLVERFII